ncbi:MAG: methyltransferase domain-containing protein [Planctomycetes bacterium]|nr:methyltransferase domain-containing protein [Planctomycetota bacterium]
MTNAPTGGDAYLDPYRRSHAQHGAGFDVTLWANPRSQRLRFEVFTQMHFFGGRRVLDAGCSRGDFAAYLVERDIPFARYIGIDALCEVVDFANKRNLPRCEFHCGDFVTKPELLRTGEPDVVCISGSLNTMTDTQVFAVLGAAWAAAGQTLMFNFLSDRAAPNAPAQVDYSRRLDTMRLLDWALSLTSQVQFRQDYFRLGHDATIVMEKAGPSK